MGDDVLIEDETYCGCPMPDEIRERLQKAEGSAVEHLMDALSGGVQMQTPTDYITIY